MGDLREVVVPREPTVQMVDAGNIGFSRQQRINHAEAGPYVAPMTGAYRAMIRAYTEETNDQG